MNKKQLQLLILVVLCVVFAVGWLWMSAQDTEEEEESSLAETTDLNLAEKDDIIAISYTYDGTTISFAQDEEGEWYYVDDPDFNLETDDVDSMVKYFCYLSTYRTIDATDADLSDYGFDDPSFTVSITETDGTERTFYFGDFNDAASAYYFMEDGGDSIEMVYSVLTTNYLDRTLDEWEAEEDEDASETDAEEEDEEDTEEDTEE
ncbi:MAG: DUF4340 domain-containing protein [Lachnospiraceae bacterium]|nr:DUF4340 domain-containing protein [Lachnospiraceae bacterium]